MKRIYHNLVSFLLFYDNDNNNNNNKSNKNNNNNKSNKNNNNNSNNNNNNNNNDDNYNERLNVINLIDYNRDDIHNHYQNSIHYVIKKIQKVS